MTKKLYGADIVIDSLRKHGVDLVFGIPGAKIDRLFEALDGKEANVARLSFSTKITDYISNGKCVLAIGRDYIAPIDYFQRNDAAIIAHSPEEIVAQVNRITDNPALIDEYGKKAFDCAVRNHEKGMMTRRFIGTMLHAVGQEYE